MDRSHSLAVHGRRSSLALALALLPVACAGPDARAGAESSSAEAAAGDAAPGVSAPPSAPEVFAPGAISSEDANETWITFSPNGREAVFSRYADDFGEQTLYISALGEEGWSAARQAPFSGRWSDRAAYSAPDGRLFFSSTRPLGAGEDGDRWRIWVVRRTAGSWGEPEPLPEVVNAPGGYHPAVAADGTVYWASSERAGGLGRSDIYAASAADGGYGEARHLDPPVNSATSEPDLYIDPDQRFMVLVVTERDGGYGGDDLWLSRRTAAGWTEPVNLGEPVNSAEYEYGPYLSGDWLYFTSHRSGQADIYRVPIRDVAVLAAVVGGG